MSLSKLGKRAKLGAFVGLFYAKDIKTLTAELLYSHEQLYIHMRAETTTQWGRADTVL